MAGQAGGAGELVDIGRVERQHRRGLRQPVAFADERAGDLFPLRRNGADHRGAAATREVQPGPVDFADVRVHRQARVQRVHPHEDARPRLFHHIDQAVHVARVGHQPVLGADREHGEEVHHQRKDVIQRQRSHDHLPVFAQRHERLELLDVGDEVAVRQRSPLGQPGGATGVLQEQQVVAFELDRPEGHVLALRQRLVEAHRRRKPRIDWRARQRGCAAVADAYRDDRLHAGLADDLGERRRRAVEDDDHFDSRIVELVLELAWRVQRVYVHLHPAGARDA